MKATNAFQWQYFFVQGGSNFCVFDGIVKCDLSNENYTVSRGNMIFRVAKYDSNTSV